MSKLKLKRLQIVILIVLNALIAVGVFPNAVFDVQFYGWSYMNNIPGFDCWLYWWCKIIIFNETDNYDILQHNIEYN